MCLIAQLEKEILLKEREIREKELREMRTTSKEFFEEKYFQLKTSEKPEDDPYDYKDLVPEVVDIPQGDVVIKREQDDEKDTEVMETDSAKGEETIDNGGDSTAVETSTDSLKSDDSIDEGEEKTEEKAEESGGELGYTPIEEATSAYRLAAFRNVLGIRHRHDQIVTGTI